MALTLVKSLREPVAKALVAGADYIEKFGWSDVGPGIGYGNPACIQNAVGFANIDQGSYHDATYQAQDIINEVVKDKNLSAASCGAEYNDIYIVSQEEAIAFLRDTARRVRAIGENSTLYPKENINA